MMKRGPTKRQIAKPKIVSGPKFVEGQFNDRDRGGSRGPYYKTFMGKISRFAYLEKSKKVLL